MDLANNSFTHVADLDERGVTLERDGKRIKFIPWGEDAEARAAAAAAQETADAAQETADTAQTTADTAETKADAAQAAAETADGKAEAAQAAADAAQETADTAQTTADTAETKADAAQAAADGLEPRVTQLEATADGLQQEVYEAHQEAVQAQTTADAAQAAAETADGKAQDATAAAADAQRTADAAQAAAGDAAAAAEAAQELAEGAVQQYTPEGVTEQRAGLKLKAQNSRWQIGQTNSGNKWGVIAMDDNGATVAECIAFPQGDEGHGYGRLNLVNTSKVEQIRIGFAETGTFGVPNHVREYDAGGGATVTLTFTEAIFDWKYDMCTFFVGVYHGEFQGTQLRVLAAGSYDRSTKVVTPGSLLAPFAKVTGA